MEVKMELCDTVSLMNSEDWKHRFVAEYLQTKIRYDKLHRMIVKREVGKCEFETPIPLESWKTQAHYMGLYLFELEKQAEIHGIDFSLWKSSRTATVFDGGWHNTEYDPE